MSYSFEVGATQDGLMVRHPSKAAITPYSEILKLNQLYCRLDQYGHQAFGQFLSIDRTMLIFRTYQHGFGAIVLGEQAF